LRRQIETAKGAQDSAAKEYEQSRGEYIQVKSRMDADETLILKLKEQTGACAIDKRIACDRDFTDFIRQTEEGIEQLKIQIHELSDKGTDAKSRFETAKKTIGNLERDIQILQDQEMNTRRDNEDLQKLIADLQNDLRDAENFEADRAARLDAKREELRGIGGCQDVAGTSELHAMRGDTLMAVQSLEEKIAEQTKARNTLANLKSSMVDSTIAGYHADAWKRIAEAVGPKGLQGELVKDALGPLTEAIQEKLEHMGFYDKVFYFQTEDDKGKEIFQFGWLDIGKTEEEIGERRNFDALSTGERILLLIALMTTIIERINPPLKALIIDNAENLDRVNLRNVLHGLTTAGANFDNIIFLGVFDIAQEDAAGWKIWNLTAENGQGREAV
jgi:exonuclease SbcC